MVLPSTYSTYRTLPKAHISSVSPSVHVIFRTVAAYDSCGSVGAEYDNVTLSFGQNELSTYVGYAAGYGGYAPISQLNYADLNHNCSQTYSVNQFGTSSYEGDQCLPWLVAPSKIVSVDPVWATCTGTFGHLT